MTTEEELVAALVPRHEKKPAAARPETQIQQQQQQSYPQAPPKAEPTVDSSVPAAPPPPTPQPVRKRRQAAYMAVVAMKPKLMDHVEKTLFGAGLKALTLESRAR